MIGFFAKMIYSVHSAKWDRARFTDSVKPAKMISDADINNLATMDPTLWSS